MDNEEDFAVVDPYFDYAQDDYDEYDDDEDEDEDDDEEDLPINTKPSDEWAWFVGYNIDTDTPSTSLDYDNGEAMYIKGWVGSGGFDNWCADNFKWTPSLMTIYLVSTAGNILAFNRRME